MPNPEAKGSRGDRSTRIDILLVSLTLVGLIVALGVTFGGADLSRPPTADREPIGELTLQTREVRRRLAGDLVWDDIEVGAPLFARDSVYVADDSAATIQLEAGGQIAIDERSLVVLSAGPAVGPEVPVLEVVRGGASGESGDRALAISAGGTTLRVAKGSRVRLRVGEDESTEVTVAQGSARVAGDGGNELELTSGQRQTLNADGTSAGAVERVDVMLQAPAPVARIFTAEVASVTFEWGEPGDWLLELAGDPGFEQIVEQVTTDEGTATVDGIRPGVYFWRVRSLPGVAAPRASEERPLIVVEDLPPRPFRPLAGGVVDLSAGNDLDLAWMAVDGAHRYQVRLREGRGDGPPLIDLEVERPSLALPKSTITHEAEHCLAVRVADREEAPWGEPHCFRVVLSPVLPPPVLFDPKDDAPAGEQGSLWWWLIGSVAHAGNGLAPLTLEWGTIPGATGYEIEIADDREFSRPLARGAGGVKR